MIIAIKLPCQNMACGRIILAGRRGFSRHHNRVFPGGSGMLRLRQWQLLVVALLVCFAPLGCGSSGHTAAGPAADGGTAATGGGGAPGGSAATGGGGAPGAPGSNRSAGAQGAPGANGQNGGGGGATAPGAPIYIPEIIHLWGRSIDDAMNSLLNGKPLPGEGNGYYGIVEQCGDTLCVNVEVKVDPQHPNLTLCQSSGRTDPKYFSKVDRGSTIFVLTGWQPCKPGQTPYPPSPDPGGGQSSTDPGGGQSSTDPGGGQSSTDPGGGQSSTDPGGGQSPVDTSSP
jgi:hypothetical protein